MSHDVTKSVTLFTKGQDQSIAKYLIYEICYSIMTLWIDNTIFDISRLSFVA